MNKVLIVGSINIDMFFDLINFPDKGETVSCTGFKILLGGKGANQAVSASRLGANVSIIGCVGDNLTGEGVIKQLQEEGINTAGIMKSKVDTGIAVIMLNDSDNRIIINPGANHQIDIDWIKKNTYLIDDADVVLLQFEIPMEVNEYVADYAKSKGKIVVINPAPASPISNTLLSNFNVMTPNQKEFKDIFKVKSDNEMLNIFERYPEGMIVTLGSDGVAYSNKFGKIEKCSSVKVDVVDTTGAGDTFNGALAFALSNRKSLKEAVELANKASAIAIQSYGAQTGMPTLQDINNLNL